MSWWTILTTVLQIASFIIRYLEKQNLMNEARRQVIADSLTKIAEESKVLDEVTKRINAMSDADVDKRLSERGDFRE